MIKVGEIYETNNYGTLEVIEYVNSTRVRVRFIDTGYERYAQTGCILRGQVKDLLAPSVCGLGYLGCGGYSTTVSGTHTKMYATWVRMFERCYDPKFLARMPTYIGCTVTKEWHNFQVFAKWFEEHYIDGYHLDKDIKVPGNKLYSPDTCMFVTQAQNARASCTFSVVLRSPSGNRVEVGNVSEFARDNALNSSSLFRVKNGKQQAHKGWVLYKEGPFEKIVLTSVFKSPEGVRVVTDNIAELSRQHNLDKSNLTKVKNGKLKQHKGWTKWTD